jgi:hypothetical protein
MDTYIEKSDIKDLIEDDADVYTEDGKLLLRFRKKVIPQDKTKLFYDNVIDFTKQVLGSDTPKAVPHIFGYFDTWQPSQKAIPIKPIIEVRECQFNRDYPDKYKNTMPFINEIDKLYKKLMPENYKIQRKKANQTYFKIPGTAFTTVAANINFQTKIHRDKKDDSNGFVNLEVIERGKYTGGETCFPQYGIGVNVRSGDVLIMDVQQPHGNLPINKKTEDAVRLSIICYLRNNIWLRTKNKTKRMFDKRNATLKRKIK